MSQTGEDYPWYALFVRVNHEIKVSSALRNKGCEEFLPLYRARHRWSDRIKEIQSPLFPGYVFCRFDLKRRLPILTTPDVHFIVGTGKAPIPIDEREINNLKLIAESQLQAEPWPYLKIGERIRIEQGALAGLEGVLLAVKKPFRLIVSVTLLQRSVAVEIDETWASPMTERISSLSQYLPVQNLLTRPTSNSA
jgi:transcription antitermination factor NusG